MSEELTSQQKEKFFKLAENVEYDGDFENLEEKLNIIKETHFKVSSPKTKMINEDHFIDGVEDKQPATDDPEIDYLAGLIR